MSVGYARHVSTRSTPQTSPIFGKKQIKNSAGGYSFQVDCWTRLDRFLILGCEGGSYYAGEQKLTRENATSIIDCAKSDATRAVDRICEISENGRAPKNDPAIFALALLAGKLAGDEAAKLALEALPRVCRIGTHLFQFIQSVTEFRSWNRGLRNAIAKWYTEKEVDDVAFQVTKYQQRNGMSHRDVLRLSHPKSTDLEPVFRWVVGGMDALTRSAVVRKFPSGESRTDFYGEIVPAQLPDVIRAFEEAKTTTSDKAMARLIREEGLVREHIPTNFLNSKVVWEALLEKMPIHAMVRNLGKMSAIGLLAPLSAAAKLVCDKLGNAEQLKRSKMHPMALLMAQKVYGQGHGDKGSLTWNPVSQVIDALDDAFYGAFANVTPTGKRWLLGLDVSGSMASCTIAGSSLTPRDASAAMALVTAATEPQHHICGFTAGTRSRYGMSSSRSVISPLAISPRQRLTDAVRTVSDLDFGPTDCALPMVYAMENKIAVDAFVVYTDSETYYGTPHPCQALQAYRDRMGIDAKLIVCGMVANEVSIADPNDGGMLDVVGFDTNVPAIMSDFVSGQ